VVKRLVAAKADVHLQSQVSLEQFLCLHCHLFSAHRESTVCLQLLSASTRFEFLNYPCCADRPAGRR
jgi:hypothetical protein